MAGRCSETPGAARVRRFGGGRFATGGDTLAVEAPLEMRLRFGAAGEEGACGLGVTLRTPGEDRLLIAGLLVAEGIVSSPEEILSLVSIVPARAAGLEASVVEVTLAPQLEIDPARLGRTLVSTTSCGLCGKASLEAILPRPPAAPEDALEIDPEGLLALPARLREAQPRFTRTGGTHAAALFDASGRRLACHEDVGRHNAVDKVVGDALFAGRLPATGCLLLVSGRASFEIVQKAAAAGVALLAAQGAPSTLARALAEEAGLTLVGFLRGARFNVYTHPRRVRGAALPDETPAPRVGGGSA